MLNNQTSSPSTLLMVWNHNDENNANRSPQTQPQRRQEGEGAGDLPGDFV